MAPVQIRPARPDESERLRAIAIAAKSHWGYAPGLVADWAARDLSPASLAEKESFVAEAEARVIGWSTIVLRGEVYWLDDLWIEPMWMGRGVGSQLFRHACARAKEAGATRLEWEAEPNALGFYERMGASYVRDSEPTVFGRVLRVMSVEL